MTPLLFLGCDANNDDPHSANDPIQPLSGGSRFPGPRQSRGFRVAGMARSYGVFS